MEYHDMLLRFVGRVVCVSTFGHVKLWGKLAAVTEDCLRLVNTSLGGESDDYWLAQQQSADDDANARHSETLVHFHHVVAISCVDDDLPTMQFATGKCSSEGPELGGTRVSKQSPTTHPEEGIDRSPEEELAGLLHVDRLELRIGYELIPLADPKQGGDLTDRLEHLRSLIGRQLGFLLPSVRIRDDARFDAEEYRVYVHGAEVARGKLRPGKLLALHGPQTKIILEGERTTEPAYSQPAVWIEPEQREEAEKAGYFTIEPGTVLVTHLQKEVRRHASSLFSLDALRNMLELTRRYAPAAVEEVVPSRVPLPRLHDLLTRLLEEEVPLRPFEFILEKVAQLDPQYPDLEELLVHLRTSLGRLVCERFRDPAGQIALFTLDRPLHDQLAEVLLGDPHPGYGVWIARFIDELRQWYAEQREKERRDLPLVVDTHVRRKLWSLVSQAIPGLMVISFAEVSHDLPIRLIASISKRTLCLQEPVPRKTSRKREAASPTKKPRPAPPSKPAQPR